MKKARIRGFQGEPLRGCDKTPHVLGSLGAVRPGVGPGSRNRGLGPDSGIWTGCPALSPVSNDLVREKKLWGQRFYTVGKEFFLVLRTRSDALVDRRKSLVTHDLEAVLFGSGGWSKGGPRAVNPEKGFCCCA